MSTPYRLAAVTSHPVQYQAPLFQRLASHPDIELTVFYGDDRSVAGEVDRGFGRPVQWDRPLLEGYRSIFLKRTASAWGPLRSLVGDARIISHLFDGRFDAVFIHSYATPLSVLAYMGALASGTPVLLRTESERLRPRNRWTETLKHLLLRPLLTVTSAVLVIGEQNRRFYEHYGVARERQFLTPYSVDNDYFVAQRRLVKSARPHLRRMHEWPDDVVVIGFSGKLIPRKGVDVLIDAVAALQHEGFRAGLLIVGDGPSRLALEERVRSRQLKWTVFAGFQNQSALPSWYVCMDAFVLPSRFETWGLVLNEAMLFDLPVVASSMVGAAEDLIETGKNGYVFEVGDVTQLADALKTFVTSPETRDSFGQGSRAIVEQYTHQACVRGILDGLRYITGRTCLDSQGLETRGTAP